MQRHGWLLAGVLLGLGAGCPFCGPSEVCTTEAVPGLSITVKHRDSMEPICDATVTATAGGYQETLEAVQGSPCRYVGAFERPGTYDVDITRATFLPASVDNVTVTQDNCHVVTEERTVVLSPS